MQTPINKRQGAKLPHWTAEGATYSVTFRLADSIPLAAAERLGSELAELEKSASRGTVLSLAEQIRLSRLKTEHIDSLLNAGHGECLLARPTVAEVVATALKHFDGQRYRLSAWCVMPNHVHVVFTPMAGHTLPKILQSWKSFTANQINKALERSGTLWLTESYDHLCRDKADFMHHVHYARENPVKAGLENWPWVG